MVSLGDWGMRWAKDYLTDEDYDVDFLMLILIETSSRKTFPTEKLKTMSDVWLGHTTYKEVLKNEDLLVVGQKALTRNITSWLSCSPFCKRKCLVAFRGGHTLQQ